MTYLLNIALVSFGFLAGFMFSEYVQREAMKKVTRQLIDAKK